MKVSERLRGVTRIFLDTAPVIYFVEGHPGYVNVARVVFRSIDAGRLIAMTSPVTVAECLVAPSRMGDLKLTEAFLSRLIHSKHTECMSIDERVGQHAAVVRARYNLSLPDSFQVALASRSDCDLLLTNDADLKRVKEIDVALMDEMEED